jgi:hypothetical protein
MDYLERQIMNFDQMGTSIDKINNPGVENKQLFKNNNSTEGTCGGSVKVGGKNVSPSKNFDMTDFVQDLEDNLDNFDNIDIIRGPKPANIDSDFKKKKETFIDNLPTFSTQVKIPKEEKEKEEVQESINDTIYKFLIEIKEPLIIILLFVLLNNPEIIALTYQLPFMNLTDNQYPSLLIRGLFLAIIIYYLRKIEKTKIQKEDQ